MTDLHGARVAFLVANEGVEQSELEQPWNVVREAGGTPVLLAPDPGVVQAFRHVDAADTFPVDAVVDGEDPASYAALVLPGGVVNADTLRTVPAAVHFVRQCFEEDLPVAMICHGPWILIDAGEASGRTMTSWPSLKIDLQNAGAKWVDEEVVVDGRLVSSRKPADLDAFCAALLEQLAAVAPSAA